MNEISLLHDNYKQIEKAIKYIDENFKEVSDELDSIGENIESIEEEIESIPKPVTPDVKLASGTIPVIAAAGGSETITVNLGELNDPNEVILMFFSSSVSDEDVTKLYGNGKVPNVDSALRLTQGSVTTELTTLMFSKYGVSCFGDNVAAKLLTVFEDFNKTTRWRQANVMEYIDASITVMPSNGFTYEDIGNGVFLGFSKLTSDSPIMGSTNKKVVVNKVWLTQSGSETILNFQMTNFNTTDTTSFDFKVAVYD